MNFSYFDLALACIAIMVMATVVGVVALNVLFEKKDKEENP